MVYTELRNAVDISCSIYSPNGEILLNRYLRDSFLVNSKNNKIERIPNLILDKNFFLEEPLTAPVMPDSCLFFVNFYLIHKIN